ncbi:uncharacterized protein B0J16DRAFT_403062 [Fusarium flagelliforme]|uniref:Hard-surface induced protein n=1 Tax=Fusarium flagelliforme TaxID=2675880 RepID=A0A395ML67_9HYPO|nr:uncharacterized protein B0J16DRAFT_403062 [Fusarium flagelliforme]KAH7179746.1 hypothetical protein B0J16DRAFT_403062 [Fusarium flagelliforme]RFN48672.1 hard-surface induced protein [Fusarium flagelliforme]
MFEAQRRWLFQMRDHIIFEAQRRGVFQWVDHMFRFSSLLVLFACSVFVLYYSRQITAVSWEIMTSAYKAGYQELEDFHTFSFDKRTAAIASMNTIPATIATMSTMVVTMASINIPVGSSPICPDFASVARSHGVDQAIVGEYVFLVEGYIKSCYDKPVRMLELGMGCRRTQAIKDLYTTWQDYLPENFDLIAVETQPVCTHLVTDDQLKSNTTDYVYFWEARAASYLLPPRNGSYFRVDAVQLSGQFDVIMDSGFHTLQKQLQAFEKF